MNRVLSEDAWRTVRIPDESEDHNLGWKGHSNPTAEYSGQDLWNMSNHLFRGFPFFCGPKQGAPIPVSSALKNHISGRFQALGEMSGALCFLLLDGFVAR